MVWSLRPEMAGMVDRMITTAYQRSKLPASEREVARMRIAQLNACDACATFRAPSVIDAGVTDDEILDLTLCCAVFLGLGRTLEVLGITDNCPLDI